MNRLHDANLIYDAGSSAIKSSGFKYSTQLFEMNHLLETAKIQTELQDGSYYPLPGEKFLIKERGKTRFICNNAMRDKTVNHLLCDEVLTPAMAPYLQYDNMASQKDKGVDLYKKRLKYHLLQYYSRYHTNEGWVLTVDLSGYYANIPHDKCKEIISMFLDKADVDPDTKASTNWLIAMIMQSMEVDVSRFTDAEIVEMYRGKVDCMLNHGADPRQLTGQKMLKKGVDIGNQISQDIGILYPYRVDNYFKIVEGAKWWGRYTDDFYCIDQDKGRLMRLLRQIRLIAKEYGLIINDKKTRVWKLSQPFRHLKDQWWLTETGKVIQNINPKSIVRERRKLKAYKRLLDAERITKPEIENSYKAWIGKHWPIMSWWQIYNMNQLYLELFNTAVTWKSGHGRLKYMMTHQPHGKEW